MNRISELANGYSIKSLDEKIIQMDIEVGMKGYEAQSRLKSLFEAKQDIHYLAMGIQEILEELQSVRELLEIIKSTQFAQQEILMLLSPAVRKMVDEKKS